MEVLKQALPDIRQRVIYLAFMFAVVNGGLWLGNEGRWDLGKATVVVGILAVALWILDPVFQIAAHQEKEEVESDGDVA